MFGKVLPVIFFVAFLTGYSTKAGNMFPPGIILNNPGMLEHTHDTWEGQSRLQTHKRFVRFDTPVAGIRAIMKTLKTYEDVHGYHTIDSIIRHWAPDNENNTEAYILDVSFRAGIPRNVLIDIGDPLVLIKLAKAITIHECGHPPEDMPAFWYSDEVFKQAAEEALGE